MTKNSHKTGQGSVLVNNLKLQVGNFGMGLKVFGRSEVGLQWWDVGIEQGTRGRGEPDKDQAAGAWFLPTNFREADSLMGETYLRWGKHHLRWWGCRIKWHARGGLL